MPSKRSNAVFDFLYHVYKTFFRTTFGNACCFHPTCSDYGHEAVKNFGAFKGVLLTVQRILRCHPLSKGGFDPVPDAKAGRKNEASIKKWKGLS